MNYGAAADLRPRASRLRIARLPLSQLHKKTLKQLKSLRCAQNRTPSRSPPKKARLDAPSSLFSRLDAVVDRAIDLAAGHRTAGLTSVAGFQWTR
jgi:hypothetical protein